MKCYIVHAFSDTAFGGNPAGVIVIEPEGNFPPEEIMMKIAAELRYSETAFVKQIGSNVFHTRYFTPKAEVELCGHATIATFHVLSETGLIAQTGRYVNRTLAGNLHVELQNGAIFMEMASTVSLGIIERTDHLKRLYAVMGLTEENWTPDQIYLPEIISTGLPDIILPVKDQATLEAIRPDFAGLAELSSEMEVVGVHAFALAADDGMIHCRNFAPLYGIDEEAATGTANGALTYYLYRHQLLAVESEAVFIQGEAMKRPSQIISRLKLTDKQLSIVVGGNAVIFASGTIHI